MQMNLKNGGVQTPVNSENGIYDIKWSMIGKHSKLLFFI